MLHSRFARLGPQDTPGSTLVTIPQVFVLPHPWAPFWATGRFGLPGFHIFRFPCCTRICPFWGPPGHPRLNLGYNSPGIYPFLTPELYPRLLVVFGLPGFHILGFRVATADFARWAPRTPQLNLLTIS